MSSYEAKLQVPAKEEYIVVVKRTAAGIACVAGLSVEEVTDFIIALTQACEQAILIKKARQDNSEATLQLNFKITTGKVDASLKLNCSKQVEPLLAGLEPFVLGAEEQLALQIMSLFVSECSYHLHPATGNLRVRLFQQQGLNSGRT